MGCFGDYNSGDLCVPGKAADRGSINCVNNSGESAHPCLVPWFSLNGCEIFTLVITDAVGEL